MLHVKAPTPGPPVEKPDLLSPAELLLRGVDIIRRHIKICVGVPLALMAVAFVYLLFTPPQYTAVASMVIDTRKAGSMQKGQSDAVDAPVDNPTVESQAEILKSENIAQRVIDDMKLANDPNFLAPSLLWRMIGGIVGLFSSSEPDTEFKKDRAAVESFERRLSVRRLGVTFVFEISFTDPDRERSAKIANAVADAYVVDQLDAQYKSTKRAALWLQDRLKELGTQTADSDRAVVAFKKKNNIVDAGGRLLTEQQLSDLNSQLALARTNMSDAQAKLTRIQEVMKLDVPDANVTDALHNEVIIKLRGQYSDLSQREAELINRLGPQHEAVIKTENDMRETRRSIRDELGRIAEGYKSDYQISKARVDSIQQSLTDVVSQSQLSDQAQVQLKQLESASESYRALYDSFLQRYMESVQQQSFPLSEARVITQATTPLKKSEPKFFMTLMGALAAGGVLGFFVAWGLEITDKALRSASDVERLVGLAWISNVPLQKFSSRRGKQMAQYIEVSTKPMSRFAESIRAVKVAVDFYPETRRPQVVGLVSAMPGEGKTTIAANLAALTANAGARTLLIDCDVRNPTLSRRLAPKLEAGLLEMLSGKNPAAAITHLEFLHCDFIGVSRGEADLNLDGFISSAALKAVLDEFRRLYDYVIIDLPPLMPVIDARAAADLIDCFVMVAEWGITDADVAQNALQVAPRVRAKTVGIVLNKVDVRRARRYIHNEYSPAHSSYYSG
jgi:succinoglycan biosynthesis transport protein ExoP